MKTLVALLLSLSLSAPAFAQNPIYMVDMPASPAPLSVLDLRGVNWTLVVKMNGAVETFGSAADARRDWWPTMATKYHGSMCYAEGNEFSGGHVDHFITWMASAKDITKPELEWSVSLGLDEFYIDGTIPAASREFWEYQQRELERRCAEIGQ